MQRGFRVDPMGKCGEKDGRGGLELIVRGYDKGMWFGEWIASIWVGLLERS